MPGAIYIAHGVGPCSGDRKKANPQQHKQSIEEHRPLLGTRKPRALNKLIGMENGVGLDGRAGRSKAVLPGSRVNQGVNLGRHERLWRQAIQGWAVARWRMDCSV